MREIYLTTIIFFTCYTTYCQESILITGDSLSKIKINNVSLFSLHNPGDNFEKLSSLSGLVDSSYYKSSVYEEHVFYYDGFKIEYVDINGRPELRKFTIDGKKFTADFYEFVLEVGTIPIELINRRNDLYGLKVEIDSKKTGALKYNGHWSCFEINLNDDKSIKNMIFYTKND